MTVSSTTASQTFACNGATVIFTCPFRVLAAAELDAYLVTISTGAQAQLVNGVDFTVTNAGTAANAIVTTATAYSNLYRLKCKRHTARLQEIDYRDNDPFPAETHETGLDRLTMLVQEDDEAIGRTIRAPDGETLSALPSATSRANTLMAFDSNGDMTVQIPTSGSAADVLVQLANTSDVTKGDANVGVKDTVSGAVGISLHAYLNLKVKGFAATYGAVGDDSTDNTTAWQTAVADGKILEIEDGTYRVNGTGTIATAGKQIIGHSRNAIIKCSSDINPLSVPVSFVKLSNFKLLGASANTQSTKSAILLTNSTRGKFDNIMVEGFAYGVDGSTSAGFAFGNQFVSCYFYLNKRAGIYGIGNSTTMLGGEIAGGVYGVLQAKVLAGTALAIDRDFSGQFGSGVILEGVTLESIYETGTITGAANNGSGLVRITQTAHGYTTGDYISVSDIVGTTEANGVWPVTVISANTYDLKTSAFANAYVSGGTSRRGVALYSGINTPGIECYGGDWEDLVVHSQWGDAYQNNGTSAHTGPVTGGCVIGGNFSADSGGSKQACLVAVGYVTGGRIQGVTGSGASTTLVNSRNVVTGGEILKGENNGFTREYDATGSVAMRGLTLKPVSRNGDIVVDAQVPDASGSATLTSAFQVVNHAGASYAVLALQSMQMNKHLKLEGGTLALTESATAPAVGNGGTIATSNLGTSRVAPAGAVTGVILEAGTRAGQIVDVINQSAAASTITFAASGTSNVADGVSAVLAGFRSMSFRWDSVTALWYRT